MKRRNFIIVSVWSGKFVRGWFWVLCYIWSTLSYTYIGCTIPSPFGLCEK